MTALPIHIFPDTPAFRQPLQRTTQSGLLLKGTGVFIQPDRDNPWGWHLDHLQIDSDELQRLLGEAVFDQTEAEFRRSLPNADIRSPAA